jgi:peptidoglycan/LPS O-acetylase OafA/YrhL
MRDGLMRFMRAHGQNPAPGQRPRTAGALAGLCAGLAVLPILVATGADTSAADALRVSGLTVALIYLGVATLGGAVYGGVFRRAASDRRGGWLFGISYGFLLWMVGPTTLLQAVLGRPLGVGTAALGLLAANLVYGLILGVLFRPMHRLMQASLGKHITEQPPMARPSGGSRMAFPHTRRAPR